MRYHDFGDGRFVARLDAGDDLIPSLVKLIKDAGIESGWVTGLGSVSDCTLGFLDPEAGEYVKRRFQEPLEVAHLTASISRDEERPFVHVHAVVAPQELLAYAGHVHSATVGVVMELFVQAFPARLERFAVPDQPFLGLFLPGEAPPQGGGDASAS